MSSQLDCQDCLLRLKRTQVVMPTPCRSGGLLAIGEAPGAAEDMAGEGFVGRAGKTLDGLLYQHGIQRGDYGRANVCRCRPVDDAGVNRRPFRMEIDACLPKLAEFIGQCRPGVILCVGWSAGRFFSGKPTLFDAILSGSAYFHPGGFSVPSSLRHIVHPVHVVYMPHTSPLAFNRKAPDGRKWSEIAEIQVKLAVNLLAF